MGTQSSPLDTFDHVVVLMLENRSFDNLLGYLYEGGAPADKKFEGASGKNLSNPDINGSVVPVSKGSDYHQPYPDPGEEFDHITAQIFGGSPLQPPLPTMQGFVKDYYATLQALKKKPPVWPGSPENESPVIMKCFNPSSLPVLTGLAQQFAVFDHWYCAVPSQTWCNRAFWHAATSWGWVNNPSIGDESDPWNFTHWRQSSATPTLFDLIESKFGIGNWRVYEDLAIPFTKLVHWGDLREKSGSDYFRYLEGGHEIFDRQKNFFDDCAAGNLPKYSFIEPHFINFFEHVIWHDDMHPSSWDSLIYHETVPGSVLLGDQLIAKVYEAIRNSKSAQGNNWRNTLFIITFDEHGGCYDHVPPPTTVSPDPKAFNTGKGQEGFDFKRLGVRVPMVMVSAYIAENTIVNSPMHHCSFLKTMQEKWGLGSLGPRQDSAPLFTEVFSSTLRPLDSWPVFKESSPPFDAAAPMAAAMDLKQIPLNDLQSSLLGAMQDVIAEDPAAAVGLPSLTTAEDARQFLLHLGQLGYFDRRPKA
jgi:phospholipase C